MEFVAEPLDDLGDPAVVVGVFLATSGRLGEAFGDFGLDRLGVGLRVDSGERRNPRPR
jgi:hypothetical protein